MDIEIFLKCLIAIFVVMDAIGNVPLFYALNNRYKKEARASHVKKATLIAAVILLLFLFFGPYILNFFGVSISSFKIAGGIILMIIGLQVVLGFSFSKKEEYSNIAIVPMATPLIAGPGTITTVMILAGSYGYILPFVAVVINLAISFLMLRYAENVINFIGKQGSEAISKITGMVIVAVAVEFVFSGWIGFK